MEPFQNVSLVYSVNDLNAWMIISSQSDTKAWAGMNYILTPPSPFPPPPTPHPPPPPSLSLSLFKTEALGLT